MKRSRALEIIEQQYGKFIDDWIKLDLTDEESHKNFIRLEERILSALEKEGMLPPFTYLQRLGTLDTAWEPEDEKNSDKSKSSEDKKTDS
jgi:hypothetical protein